MTKERGRARLGGMLFGCIVWGIALFATGQAGLEVRDSRSPPGAEVTAVSAGTPAAIAGLQAGDVIVKAQGAPVADADQFRRAAQRAAAGSPLSLRISRQGWERDVRLAEAPVPPAYGIAVKVPGSGPGASIASVVAASPAAAAGLRADDRVVRADGRAVAGAAELTRLLEDAATAARSLALTVERDGWAKDVTLAPQGAAPNAAASEKAVGSPAPTGMAADTPAAPAGGESLADDMDQANRLYDAGKWSEAEVRFRRVLETVPDEPRVWGRLCHVRVMQQRYAEARETCQRAAQLAPREASACQNMAYTLFRLGQPDEAVAWYRKAIEIAPDWAAPYEGIGAAQMAMRDWSRAEEYYRLAVARDPRNASMWQFLGDAAGEQGRAAAAVAHYRKAQELGASNAVLYRSLGWHLYKDGRLADAEQALLEANRLNPGDAFALVSLGLVEEKLGRINEAKRAWQRAAELDPNGSSGSSARQNLAAFELPPPSGAAPERGAHVPQVATAPGAPRAAAMVPAAVAEPRATPLAGPVRGAPGVLPSPLPGERMKATVAIGDFKVRAAGANQAIGDGLREMLVTALHGNGNFIVVERMDIQGLAAEQALSRSRLAREGSAVPERQMDVADIMIYGAVTEFESDARGGGLSIGVPNVPMTLGVQSKAAHMAIDVRVVDVTSGRILATSRIAGEARSVGASVGANISAHGVTMPATLGGFANTPMEQAIRDCIDKAAAYVVANTPRQYFRRM